MPEKIDWEDLKWGTFTKQFAQYKLRYKSSKIKDLEGFANMILKNSKKYKETTIKRANFYINVILKHKKNMDAKKAK